MRGREAATRTAILNLRYGCVVENDLGTCIKDAQHDGTPRKYRNVDANDVLRIHMAYWDLLAWFCAQGCLACTAAKAVKRHHQLSIHQYLSFPPPHLTNLLTIYITVLEKPWGVLHLSFPISSSL